MLTAYGERAGRHSIAREVDPGVWVASVAGLDGAYGEGASAAEAAADLPGAIIGWASVKLRLGQYIPVMDGLDLNPR